MRGRVKIIISHRSKTSFLRPFYNIYIYIIFKKLFWIDEIFFSRGRVISQINVANININQLLSTPLSIRSITFAMHVCFRNIHFHDTSIYMCTLALFRSIYLRYTNKQRRRKEEISFHPVSKSLKVKRRNGFIYQRFPW